MDTRRDDRLTTADLITRALAEQDEDARWRHIVILQQRGDAEVFDAAQALCTSDKSHERELGVNILAQGQVGDKTLRERSVPLLLNLLGRETDLNVICSLCFALGHLKDERAIEPVARWATHPDAEIRYAVVHGLLTYEDDLAIQTLITLSADQDEDVRDWATAGLGSLVETDTPELREALAARLDDPHRDTRAEAIRGLALRHDARVVEPLLRELAQDDVWITSVETAREIGDPRLLPALMRLQVREGEDDLLSEAIRACQP